MVGRFLQEDSYRGDGLNLYAYCANNPVVYYDPSGHLANNCPEDPVVKPDNTQGNQIGNDIYDPTKPLSPSNYPPIDPDDLTPPVRYEPKTIEEVERMRQGKGPTTRANAGDRNIEAHHRGQKSVENGGIIDELEERTHRRGGNHKRHSRPSELTPKQRSLQIKSQG